MRPEFGSGHLLKAYRTTFSNTDDVCLVVKDVGAESFYRNESFAPLIEELKFDTRAPEILYLNEELSQSELARLYSACDILVHPYRAEGFALPVLEAMACGRPVIVTAGGPTDDFVPNSAGWKIPAKIKYFGSDRVHSDATISRPWWLEPDVDELSKLLRQSFSEVTSHIPQGNASGRIAHSLTWDRSAVIIEDRVRQLRTRFPIRF
ncbi:glycosyltransferase [Telmatocola sphagniphila]|uniref:Glycosyltransferase n=1 Tax=Telmatocola sphagniphila TaxID=1123043 RepID=A0A8E6B2R4_9BACT|nr:glycosyltransferase [Telmatocola sphagniphila]QVL30344.1 glycosyltransferase [Telmatocola sphagniphila]